MVTASGSPPQASADAPPAAPEIKMFVPPGHFYSPIVDPAGPRRLAAMRHPAPIRIASDRLSHPMIQSRAEYRFETPEGRFRAVGGG